MFIDSVKHIFIKYILNSPATDSRMYESSLTLVGRTYKYAPEDELKSKTRVIIQKGRGVSREAAAILNQYCHKMAHKEVLCVERRKPRFLPSAIRRRRNDCYASTSEQDARCGSGERFKDEQIPHSRPRRRRKIFL